MKSSDYIKYIKTDIPAGIVVFLVALPLCLGIALASGAPLFSGIVSGVIGGIVIGFLSGSQLSVSGPAAGLTVIVLTAINKLGSFEAFLMAVVLAGVIQLTLGFLKAGIVGHFFPSSVILIGISVALFFVLKSNFHEKIIVSNNNNNYFIKLQGDVSFLNKALLRRTFEKILDGGHVSIDQTDETFIDQDIMETIMDFIDFSRFRDVSVDIKK